MQATSTASIAHETQEEVADCGSMTVSVGGGRGGWGNNNDDDDNISQGANDLCFQAISWHAEDVVDDDMDVESEKSSGSGGRSRGGYGSEPAVNKHFYTIKVFGRTAEGKTVGLTVRGFTPYFYIRMPEHWSSAQLGPFHKWVLKTLGPRWANSLKDIRIIRKKDFWGFTNCQDFGFIRLVFWNQRAMKLVVNKLWDKDVPFQGRNMRFRLYESNIDPYIRFMHLRNIEPSGWITLPAAAMKKPSTMLMSPASAIDCECNWRYVEGAKSDTSAPFIIASFDIECSSSHGDFPVPVKNYKRLAMQVYDLYKHHIVQSYDIFNQTDVIQVAILKALGCEARYIKAPPAHVQTMVDCVYFKNPEIVDSGALANTVKRGIEDVITILQGKFVGKDEKLTREKIIAALLDRFECKWKLPPLKGDHIIQIGTTCHSYGEKQVSYKHIITLGTCEPIDGVVVEVVDSEEEMLLRWKDHIRKLDPDIMTGYNIFGFDFWYMAERAKQLGIEKSFMRLGRFGDARQCEFKEAKLSSSALGDNLLKYIDMEGRVLIDLMKVVQRDHKLDSYKLDNVASHFLKMNKHDVSPQDVFRLQKGSAADRKIIAEYCVQDCALVNQLIMKLEVVANNMGMSNVCLVPLSFIFMRGQGIKIFSLVLKECYDLGYVIPVVKPKDRGEKEKPKPAAVVRSGDDEGDEEGGGETRAEEAEGYEGAIVLEPKVGIYLDEPVAVLDYASLYPSSMISENLSHDMLVIDPRYDNIEGVEYLEIRYDQYDANKNKLNEKICRFVQPPDGKKGIIPTILQKLLKARKDTRALIPKAQNEFQAAVLDGLQNAYKVTANSLYGQIGAATSPIYLKDIAACTTATGRKMILKAKAFLEENYCANIIYGDSVAGYTPTVVRINGGKIVVDTVEHIARDYGSAGGWIPCVEVGKQDKEALELPGVEVWTSKGWTPAYRLIRHAVGPQKKMLRVVTGSGVVDVTEDHSLIRANGRMVQPRDVRAGDALLHADPPQMSMEECGWTAVCVGGFTYMCPSQIQAARVFCAAHSQGYTPIVEERKDGGIGYMVTVTTRDESKEAKADKVLGMREIAYKGYVYDFTTGNHTFAAGIGRIIVHNTDSIFCVFPQNGDSPYAIKQKGHAAIMPSIELAMKASGEFKKTIKRPHDLEFDKCFWPFVLLSKKRYVGNKYEEDDQHFKQTSMGIVLKRRDNANIVKRVYGGVIDIILNKQDIGGSVKFLKNCLNDLVAGQCPMDDLIITKSLRADYKDPTRIAHKVLAERMGERDPGNKPQVNDRIPYIYIQPPTDAFGRKKKNVLQGERIEHPDYIKAHELKPDYAFYITNQIMKPILQVYGIVVEQLSGYKKPEAFWEERRKVEGMTTDKWLAERENVAEELLFGTTLRKLENTQKRQKEITDYLTPAKPSIDNSNTRSSS